MKFQKNLLKHTSINSQLFKKKKKNIDNQDIFIIIHVYIIINDKQNIIYIFMIDIINKYLLYERININFKRLFFIERITFI